MEERAQGALEYLLIIGAAIIVVAVAVYAVMTMATTASTDSTNATTSIQGSYDELSGTVPANACGSGIYYNPVTSECCTSALPIYEASSGTCIGPALVP
jgi:hypothetical protein